MTFWTKFASKGYFQSKAKKNKHYDWVLDIRISLGTKFQVKLIILTFWTKFAPKGYFQLKTKKSEQHHWILHIQISLGIKFHLRLIILIFLDQICPKRVFLVENEKSEHDHWILHIRISLNIKFHLKLTIQFFGSNLPKKGISCRKGKKWTSPLNSAYLNLSKYQVSPETDKKSEQHHWILHSRIRLGAVFLGAMALLGQSRESWLSLC